MIMSDPYATLGLTKSATDDEIRKAYRRLAKKYHPDLNPDNKEAEEKFKQVGKAYEILGDKEKRNQYDQGAIDGDGQPRGFGGGGFGGGGFGPRGFGGGAGFGGAGASPEDLQDILRGFGFGGGGFGARGPRAGEDVRSELTIPFLLSVLGGDEEIFVNGKSVSFKIPPGITNGQTLRLKGKGQPGRGGAPAGNLLLTIHIKPDHRYEREGRDLRTVVDIDFKTAILGGKLEIPTPQGSVRLTVPADSDSGKVLRVPGRGIAADKTHAAGNLLVTLRVILGKVDSKLKAFLQEEVNAEAP
ncbi:J domain-containing protein [Acetobacteraceae bacterium]|nr:J domain-containing protein [Acetobacteraceae bacterium]